MSPFVLLAFTSAKEGLARLAVVSIDALVCDLMMPETTGMDMHARWSRRPTRWLDACSF